MERGGDEVDVTCDLCGMEWRGRGGGIDVTCEHSTTLRRTHGVMCRYMLLIPKIILRPSKLVTTATRIFGIPFK